MQREALPHGLGFWRVLLLLREAAAGGREAARVAIFSAVARQPGQVAGARGVHARARLAFSDATAGEVAELVGRAGPERRPRRRNGRRRGRRRRGERATTTAARAALHARREVRVVVESTTSRPAVIPRAIITTRISGRIIVHAWAGRRRGRRRRGERATTTAARATLLARREILVVVASACSRITVVTRRGARITICITGRIIVHA